MAAWSGLIWHDAIDMLEHGTNFCYVPKSPLFIHCNKTKTIRESREIALRNPGTISVPELLEIFKLSDVEVKRTDQGIYLSLKENFIHEIFTQSLKEKIELKGRENSDKIIFDRNTGEMTYQSASYSTKTSYANLGW